MKRLQLNLLLATRQEFVFQDGRTPRAGTDRRRWLRLLALVPLLLLSMARAQTGPDSDNSTYSTPDAPLFTVEPEATDRETMSFRCKLTHDRYKAIHQISIHLDLGVPVKAGTRYFAQAHGLEVDLLHKYHLGVAFDRGTFWMELKAEGDIDIPASIELVLTLEGEDAADISVSRLLFGGLVISDNIDCLHPQSVGDDDLFNLIDRDPNPLSNNNGQLVSISTGVFVVSGSSAAGTLAAEDTLWNGTEHPSCGLSTGLGDGLRIYPNPVVDRCHVSHLEGRYRVFELLDGLGNVLRWADIARTDAFCVDMAALPAGIYFLRLWRDGQPRMVKVLKR